MTKQAFLILTNKVADGKASEAELQQYNQYLNLFKPAEDAWDESTLGNRQEIENVLLRRITDAIGFEKKSIKRIPLYQRNWVRAAAVLILIFSGAIYFIQDKKHTQESAIILHDNKAANNPLLPASNKAVLVLGNGSRIVLDDVSNGDITHQKGTKVIKLNSGQLSYQSTAGNAPTAGAMEYNTLTTPKGGQYQVTLADNTIVWLNAGSSIRFPVAFTGKERVVELTGEAYFEVAKNAAQPFKVKVKNSEIAVLGTHFNIMGYDNESLVKTTLLEGSVKVNTPTTDIVLSPGQQSKMSENGGVVINKEADIEEVMAWKNGLFQFEGKDVESVMRELARWYDIDVIFTGKVNKHFSGKITRNVSASKVFEMLEATGEIHFQVQGNRVSVGP